MGSWGLMGPVDLQSNFCFRAVSTDEGTLTKLCKRVDLTHIQIVGYHDEKSQLDQRELPSLVSLFCSINLHIRRDLAIRSRYLVVFCVGSTKRFTSGVRVPKRVRWLDLTNNSVEAVGNTIICVGDTVTQTNYFAYEVTISFTK